MPTLCAPAPLFPLTLPLSVHVFIFVCEALSGCAGLWSWLPLGLLLLGKRRGAESDLVPSEVTGGESGHSLEPTRSVNVKFQLR